MDNLPRLIQGFLRLSMLISISIIIAIIIFDRFVTSELQDIGYFIIDTCSVLEGEETIVDCFTEKIAYDYIENRPSILWLFVLIVFSLIIDVFILAVYFIKFKEVIKKCLKR